ncbi:thimet oligopeptidase [Kockovaella imperatae]|uniref:Thimet oligopeptidase n=1 Tax=Kockovaella imperatae TaxID=4999 RepID=A0A1Y1URN6_9TREE|nr:thimet oligopeptidase [Kockovaella imperatae]ORX40164.1 thimet oligopeptidase [Kockovaella imperatae]
MPPRYDFEIFSDASDYRKRWTSAADEARSILGHIESSPDSFQKDPEAILESLNAFWVLVLAGVGDATLFGSVHPDEDVREEAQKSETEFKKLITELGMSKSAYEAVNASQTSGRIQDDITHFWMDKMLKEYRREGVDKDDATKETIKRIKEEIDSLKTQFDKNLAQDSREIFVDPEQLDGLPEDFIKRHPVGTDGKVKITTNRPDLIPFLNYSRDSKAREALYRANANRGYPQNGQVMLDLFTKRQELASLLGFANHADHRLEPEMVENGTNAQDFIDRIDSLSRERLNRDLEELAEVGGYAEPKAVPAWDAQYLAIKVQNTKYGFDASSARQYFPFGRVRDGVLASMEKLFNVKFEKRTDVPVWHEDVVAYELLAQGRVLGRFYLDLHPRDNKYKHAGMFTIRCGSRDILPEASLVCNFVQGEDALMEHVNVKTFFHEFGHLLHHIFASGQRWTKIAGISCDWDFIEAPSQMLEEWAYDPETLKSFAVSAQGQTIPDEVIRGLGQSRRAGRASTIAKSISLAALALRLHQLDKYPLDSIDDIDKSTQICVDRYGPHKYVPDTHQAFQFTHLSAYSAAYYCYRWSQVISLDLFTQFAEKGLYDPSTAQRYRKTVLSAGGQDRAKNFVAEFLGRPHSFDALLAYLND